MLVKGITDEDFINYKKPSMFIAMPHCTFKCDKENGSQICQNSSLVKQPDINIQIDDLVKRYMSNNISKAVVFGGLEPFDDAENVLCFISALRKNGCLDDVVIYTGYTKEELNNICIHIFELENVIIKFGRYIPNQQPHLDHVLGVVLASDNQYAEKVS